jgi:cellulose synthase/poly-beta-1,6-N-acetylglucosamine synthase-like glycosyltransferase
MSTALSALLALPGLLLLLWALLLAFQGLASLLPDRRDAGEEPGAAAPRYAVLMPAHNEEDIIESTVRDTLQHMGRNGRLLVVADNCTDATAALARGAGAEVVERRHADEKGKGYALAHGLAQLADDPPDVVVILDADCQVKAGTLDILVTAAQRFQRPIQGRYDMLPPQGAGRKQRIAAFAWDFRSRFRAEGYRRLGLPCQLMGSGMAFPWPLLQRVSLANGHLVEDLKLGLDLARIGSAPLLRPAAVLSSYFPMNEQGAQSQRQRWEHGHLSMVFSSAPALLREAIGQRNGALLAMVLDMSVPPLAFLVLTTVLYAGLTTALAWVGWVAPPVAVLGFLSLSIAGASVMLGWWRVGRRWIGVGELLTTPIYVLRKLPVYAAFLSRKRLTWIRTRRD